MYWSFAGRNVEISFWARRTRSAVIGWVANAWAHQIVLMFFFDMQERNSRIDHWETKWEIENYVRKLGLPATILRPAAFMENYYIDQVEIGILKGKLMDPIRADKPYQTIASEDIGAFAALAFERPKEFIGLELEIAGSELTNPDAAQIFSRVLGKPVKFRRLPLPLVRLVLGKEFHQMFRWFNEEGFKADIKELRSRY